MSSSDAFWLNVWGIIAAIGFIIVIIGVVIEGVEHFKKFPRKENARKLQIEKIGWFLVVVGLAMEFLGDHAAKRISDREDARVKKEAGDAMTSASKSESNSTQVLLQVADLNKEAGDARKDAGEAMKSAAKFDAARAEAEKEAAEIRSKNLQLQLQLEPRRITLTQITNFIFLTDKIPKIPIRIGIGEPRDEPFNYAWQIRQMFNQAKFMPPDSDTNQTAGIFNHSGLVVFQPIIGDTDKWVDLDFYYNSTNSFSTFTYGFEMTNGFIRPIIPQNEIGDTNRIFSAVAFCFEQIGITNIFTTSRPDIVSPGQFEVLVIQKPQ